MRKRGGKLAAALLPLERAYSSMTAIKEKVVPQKSPCQPKRPARKRAG